MDSIFKITYCSRSGETKVTYCPAGTEYAAMKTVARRPDYEIRISCELSDKTLAEITA